MFIWCLFKSTWSVIVLLRLCALHLTKLLDHRSVFVHLLLAVHSGASFILSFDKLCSRAFETFRQLKAITTSSENYLALLTRAFKSLISHLDSNAVHKSKRKHTKIESYRCRSLGNYSVN